MSAQPSPQRNVAVGGDIRDSILVLGDRNVLEVALGEDAILRRLLSADSVRVTRRAQTTRPPPAFADHLDRVPEVQAVTSAGGHVNLHGGEGIGKTYVLLAALDPGAVYIDAAGRPLDDLLQALVEELFECDPPLILTPERRRRELRDVEAVVAFDGLDEPAPRLLTDAPRCRFVIASRRRTLMQAAPVHIEGLPLDAALELLHDDGEGARRLVGRLEGHPLLLLQAAALAAETGVSLADLATGEPLAERVRAALTPADRDLLARLCDVPLGPATIVALGGPPDTAQRLVALEARGLVRSHSPRYTLAFDAPPPDPRALADWAESAPPEAVLAESRALLAAQRRGEAVRIARALDLPLAKARRWESWLASLQAAYDTGGAATRAWALHQIGTRAYALGDAETAVSLLERALTERETLGDARGAANTRHNLEFIRYGGPPPPRETTPTPDPRPNWGVRVLVALAVAALLAVIVAVVARGRDDDGAAPTVTISSPRDGETYDSVRAQFSCDGDHTPVSCEGSVEGQGVESGAQLPDEPGPYTLSVVATDAEGTTARESVDYAIGSPTPTPTPTPSPSPTPSPTASPTPSPTPSPTTAPAACADGLDNDNDGAIDLRDPGCSDPADTDEVNPAGIG